MATKTRTRKAAPKAKRNVYAEVTDRIIEALEEGAAPWDKPWSSIGGPRSIRNRPYRGVNVFLLEMTAAMKGYASPFWLTYRQAEAMGGHVMKGEKGTQIILWTFIERLDEKTGEKTTRPFLKYYTVFNVEQCEGVAAPTGPVEREHTPVECAEAVIAGMQQRPVIKHGGDRAYYSPGLDYVGLPTPESFVSGEAYYSTSFHELVHSTGHESRIDRKFGDSFGDESYGKEELIAELGAAFLNGHCGIEGRTEARSASYLANWIGALKGDEKLIVQAAAAAQKAADFILGTTFDVEEES